MAVAAASPLAINIYLPSMPAMAGYFQVDFATIQLTLSVYLIAVALGQLVMGPLSDRYGRRPVLLSGIACFVLGSLLCLIASSIETLLVARVVQAVGGCAGITLSRAIVRDLYPRDQAASMLGYVTMGMAIAPMLAPSLGGVLEAAYGWQAGFAFLLGFGLLILLAAFRGLHETNPRRGSVGAAGQMLRGYAKLVRSGPFWGYSFATAFASGVFFSFVAGGSYVMIEIMGRSALEFGLYFAAVPGGYILGNFFTGRFSTRAGSDRLMLLGGLACLISVALIAAAFAAGVEHPLALFAPMIGAGVGNGMLMPAGIAGAISARPDAAGAAAGLSGAIQMGVAALVAPLVGALLTDSAWPMIAVMGVSATLSLLSFTLVRHGTGAA